MTATIAIGLSLILTGLGAWLAAAAVHGLARLEDQPVTPHRSRLSPGLSDSEFLPGTGQPA